MTTKQILTMFSALTAAALVVAAIVLDTALDTSPSGGLPAKAGTPARAANAGTGHSVLRTEYSALNTPSAADVTLAAQKARLALSDGRTATFAFATTAGTLTAHAAIGLDHECNFALLPLVDPPPPNPEPTPQPAPQPRASNLRVLFTYDPTALANLAPARQAILASPELRSYLEKHCPLESNCTSGMCPLSGSHTASYRFLPAAADAAQLPPVWQGIFNAARAKPAPWLLVVNEAGQTVVDQSWPGSVEETLALLKRFGGE